MRPSASSNKTNHFFSLMKKRYALGNDIAKETFDFCLLNDKKVCLWRGQFANNQAGFKELLEGLKARGFKLKQIHFALEATGVYGRALVAALHSAGLAVSVLNPAQVKFFGASHNWRTKNDRADAELIALYCLERQPVATRPLRLVEEQLKMLVHEREARANEQTRERNRCQIDQAQPCRLPPTLLRQRRQRLEQLKTQIDQLDSAIKALLLSDTHLAQQAKLLCTIPGIALCTAAKVLAQLAGKEFCSARQLAAYAGLTPSERRSGKTLYAKTRLSKIGNRFLRKALYMPAATARRWCQPIAKWADSLQDRHLQPLAIRGAVMRKLLHIIFGVLKNQQPFNPNLAAGTTKLLTQLIAP
jgi:transposase